MQIVLISKLLLLYFTIQSFFNQCLELITSQNLPISICYKIIMPKMRCTVAVCNNSDEKTKKAGLPVHYYKFPQSQPYRNIWIQRCRRAGIWNPNNCHVCSIHFTEEDYKPDDPRQELVNSTTKKKLKPTAIPSLFLTKLSPIECGFPKRRTRKFSESEDQYSFDDINTMYLPSSNYETVGESADELASYDSFTDDSNNETKIKYEFRQDNPLNTGSSSDCVECYDKCSEDCRRVKIEEPQDHEEQSFFRPRYVTVNDISTQRDSYNLLKNYNQLLSRNENLETEVVTYKNKCKKLMAKMRFLESELQRLTLNSAQGS